jgi:hypothetical protein
MLKSLFAVFVLGIVLFIHAAPATCIGSDPCNACKNCRYCRHCAKEGGKCGVCKWHSSSSRSQTMDSPHSSPGISSPAGAGLSD